jgi:hypothetical protein
MGRNEQVKRSAEEKWDVYYSYPSNCRGTLRATLSPEQVRIMLKEHSIRCAGKDDWD